MDRGTADAWPLQACVAIAKGADIVAGRRLLRAHYEIPPTFPSLLL
jgi:hypothetical protein